MPSDRTLPRNGLRWLVAALAASLVLLGSALVWSDPVGATFPGPNGLIVYQSDLDDDSRIVTSNPDGTGTTVLSNLDDFEPAWSPDGTKIVFYSWRDGQAEIYVMNANGSGQTRLTNNPALDVDPSWSPDGKIVFESNRDNDFDIYTMNADGTGLLNLTNNTSDEFEPAWSPDGTKIAFESDPGTDDDEIFVMNSDGSGRTRLTFEGEEFDPTWSPDGTKIVFHSNRDDDPFRHIYLMNADGTLQTRLTFNAWDDYSPAWSPDGTKIVFGSNRNGDNSDVFAMNPDGSGQTPVSSGERDESEPDWQAVPDPGPSPSTTGDTHAPETFIQSGPRAETDKRKVKFEFSSSEFGSTFQCKIDKKAFKPCTSPKRYKDLTLGMHRFKVKATDGVGNVDPTPAKDAWKVVR